MEISCNFNLDILPLDYSSVRPKDNTLVANKGKIEKGIIKDTIKTLPDNDTVLKYFEISNIQVTNGSSGSPVVNKNGEVIGIVAAKGFINNELISYAIPVSDVKKVIESIKNGVPYRHEILGIEAEGLPENSDNFPGVIVNKVYDHKIAYSLLKIGDIIKSFDGYTIADIHDLKYALFMADKNQNHNLEIVRNTQYMNLSFKLKQN